MTNEIVAKNDENQQLFTVSDDLMAKMSQDAETYKDETDVADLTIPRLKLVSDLSMRLGREANPIVANFRAVGYPVGGKGDKKVMEIFFLNDDIDNE